MNAAYEHTLNDGQVITAKHLADKLKITTSAARYRLKKTNNAELIFKSTKDLLSGRAQIWTLDDGTKVTVRELTKKTGLKENTLRQRLAISTDPNEIFKPQVFDNLNANIYTLSDGTELTVKELAKSLNISSSQAHSNLKDIAISVRKHKTLYLLDNGQKVTLQDVINITGLSLSGAKKRINKSKIASEVLMPYKRKEKPSTDILSKPKFIAQKKGHSYRLEECPKTGKLKVTAI